MINKFVPDIQAALEGVQDGSVILIGGFGAVGQPNALIEGLLDLGVRNLTVVSNNAGADFGALPKIIGAGIVGKIICSYPRSVQTSVFARLYAAGKIELEVVPQGTLAERLRAAAAGIPAFFTPTGAGTILSEGKETRMINGKLCVLAEALFGDFALLEAWEADRWGNLTYRLAGRNFNPVMAGAAKVSIAQTQHVAALGTLDPDRIITPGVFINRVVHLPYASVEMRG